MSEENYGKSTVSYEREYEQWGGIDNNDYAVCPHCYYENKDPDEYCFLYKETIKAVCDMCKKTFELKKIVDVIWHTKRIEE